MGCNQSVEVVSGGTNPKGEQNVEASTADHHRPLHFQGDEEEEENESSLLIRNGDASGSDQDLLHDDYTKDYSIVKQVTAGKNALSSIYMVLKRHTGEEPPVVDDNVYVLQVINMKSVAPERRKSMRKEIHSLKTIHHPNILRVHDIYDATRRNNTIATVTELCTGSHLHSTVPYPEARAKRVVSQILDALHYMHQRGLFHNSLTTENILFQDDSQDAMVKITYAGVTAVPPSSTGLMLPKESDWDPYRKDIYSVGMITYKLLSGGKEPPTDLDTHLVVPGTSLFLGRRWKLISISKNAKNFVEKCLHWNSESAFTVEQAMQHPWMTQEHVHRSDTNRSPEQKKDIVVVKWNSAERPSEVTPVVSLSREQYEREVKSRIGAKEEHAEETIDDTPVFIPVTPDAVTNKAVEDAEDSLPENNEVVVEETILNSTESDETKKVEDASLVESPDVIESPTVDKMTVIAPLKSVPDLEATDESINVPLNDTAAAEEIPAPMSKEESTPEEFLDLREAFDEAAADSGGGDVNVDVLKAKLKTKYTEEEVNSWFQGGDKYEDTRILDYQVFLRKAIQNRRTIEVQRVDAAFKKIDKGRRGFVTVGNLRAVLGTDNSENIELLIKAADTKRDGRITYENFELAVQNMLAANEKDK